MHCRYDAPLLSNNVGFMRVPEHYHRLKIVCPKEFETSKSGYPFFISHGLLGAADGALLLTKEKRTSLNATLDISGRDQQDMRLTLIRDQEKLLWNLESTETELWKEPPEPLLEAVSKRILYLRIIHLSREAGSVTGWRWKTGEGVF